MSSIQTDNLQPFKAKYREIIARAVVAESSQPEQWRADVSALLQELQDNVSEAECVIFTEFVIQETKNSKLRLDEKEARLAKQQERLRKSERRLADALAVQRGQLYQGLYMLSVEYFDAMTTD